MEETDQIRRRKTGNWRSKNVNGDHNLQYWYEQYKKKKVVEKKINLPPDEQRCCLTGSSGWRCKNFRMSHGGGAADDTVPKSKKHCEKHYNYYANYHKNLKKKKKRSGDGEETRGSKGRKKVKEEGDESEVQKLRATSYSDTSNTIIEGGTANIRRKRKNIERTERSGAGGPESPTRKKVFEEGDETEIQKLRATIYNKTCNTIIEGGSAHIRRKRKNVKRTEGSGEPESSTRIREPVVELEILEHYKTKCFELSVELEKKKVECTKLQVKLAEVVGCVDWRDSEMIDSQWRGLQNDVPQSGEKQRDETGSGGREYTRVYELKKREEERPSQHGSPSQDHLKMSKKPFVNLVSDYDSGQSLGGSEDSDNSSDTNTSLGTLMDMLAMKYRKEDQEIRWKSKADMLSSIEEDPELSMKAICALYRQHVAEVKISTKGLFHHSDALRATTLAKFLMDGACKGDLKKSVKELEEFNSKGVEECKRLARSYSKQLFNIYQNGKDPFFLLGTTASHGYQTA